MLVTKRSGQEVEYDRSKIETAILKASSDTVGQSISEKNLEKVVNSVEERAKALNRAIQVEQLQDLVIDELYKHGLNKIGRSYEVYRYKHALLRKENSIDKSVLALLRFENEEIKQENSNKNCKVAPVLRDYLSGEVSKDIMRRYVLPQDIVEAHDTGLIHVHDMDFVAMPIHNCFSGKEKLVTDEGVKAFEDFQSGEEICVLDMNGEWRSAIVRQYPELQSIQKVTFTSGRSEKVVYCTSNHRWLLKDGTVTTNLKVGDRLTILPTIKEDLEIHTKDQALMFCFGFIIGDGCDYKNYVTARLCGDKKELTPIFEKAGFSVSFPKNLQGDAYVLKVGNFKQSFLTDKGWRLLSKEQKQYLFKGYYAADGFKDRHGVATADERIEEMIEDISALAGYHISSKHSKWRDTDYKTNAYLTTYRFRKYQNSNQPWIVKNIEETSSYEKPWCVEEPVTNSFTLANGMVTGNCCLIDLDEVLNYGTVINGTYIEKPKSFETACTIASQVCAAASASQFGGMSITCSHLAPFVDVSRQKHRKRVKEEFDEMGITYTEQQINDIAEKRTKTSIKDGIQTFNFQINSLMMGSGQSPFTTVNLDINEVEPGQTQDDLALIIEEVINQRLEGMKNEVGVPVSPAFPKLIYFLDENNVEEGSKWFYLTELSARCSAKRLTPDYMSRKIMKDLKKGDCYPVMGCRSALTPDRFTDTGIGNIAKVHNYDPDSHKYYGRFNQGVVTINLVDVACSAEGNEEKFWQILDERAELCHRALMIRHETLKGTPSDFAPIMFQQGVLARLDKGETIDELLYHGYSTISLGYAGLWETVYRMKNCPMTSDEGHDFGIRILQKLNEYTAKWKAETDIDFSLYGTPMETLVYKFARCLQKRFGLIPHVTDKNYITNSYHIHVTHDIDAFSKISFESKFQELSPGGAITYIEAPDLQGNIPAVLAIIKHIYDTIMYAEINVKSDFCQTCSYDGEIQIVTDEHGKYIWQCPNCGETSEDKLNVARRVCGYISTNFFNQGRTQEIKERVLHI